MRHATTWHAPFSWADDMIGLLAFAFPKQVVFGCGDRLDLWRDGRGAHPGVPIGPGDNFAIAATGAFSGSLLYLLVINWNVPFWLALAVGIVVGACIGAAIELVVVRRLFSAPRVILLVALIGASQLLQFFGLILPQPTAIRPYPTAFTAHGQSVGCS